MINPKIALSPFTTSKNSSGKQNTKKHFSRLDGGVQTIYLYLRAVYIDAVLILFLLIFILIYL